MTSQRQAPQDEHAQRIGESARDYPHSSGDRNTKKSEADWKEFHGGKQRDAGPVPDRGKG